jgi:two-component system OmpR family response regulator
MRLLIVEDEGYMAKLLGRGFPEEGYATDIAESGSQALVTAASMEHDAAILDVMLPDVDGFELCARLRQSGWHVPVLMLTARDSVSDRVKGLDAGADDYLCKPFSLDELLARVRALLRRGPAAFGARVALGDLVLDAGTLTLWRAGVGVELSPRECAVLELLMRERGRIVPRDRIVAEAWPRDEEPRSNVLEVLIRRIREKIGTESIQTVRGVGYRIRVP